jgi:uncharacterized protein (TIGR01244 family)
MLRQLDERTYVSGQISPGQVAELKTLGISLIVNNRPDGEDLDQPSGSQIEAAARQAGIDYRSVPIRRGPGPAEVEAMRDALDALGDGKMLAYCRSGTRSTFAWALARRGQGASFEDVERCARAAGYQLGPISHLL